MVADFPLNKRSRREPGGLWDASNASAHITYHAFSRVLCCCSVAKLCPALSDTLDCSTPGSSILWSLCYWSLLQLMSIHEPVMLSHHPLSPLLPFAFSLSQHLVFSIEAALHIRWPKYWSFSMGPSNDYSGLISCRIDWFDQCGKVLYMRMWICQYGTHWSLASSFQCCFESSGIIYILTFCMWSFPLLPSLYLTICRTWFFSLLFWNDMYKVLFSSLILGTWVIFSNNKRILFWEVSLCFFVYNFLSSAFFVVFSWNFCFSIFDIPYRTNKLCLFV